MARPVQVRDVPDDVHDALRAKAARAGLSLSAYLRRVLEREALRPTVDDVLSRPGGRAPDVTMDEIVGLLRRDRDASHAPNARR